MLLSNFIEVLLFQLFLFIPGFYFLKLLNKRFFNNNISILLSCSASILGFGLIFLVLKLLKSPPVFFLIINAGIIVTLVSLAYKKKLLGEIFKIDKVYKYGLALILIGATTAASFVSVNTDIQNLDNWRHSRKIAERGLAPLPMDNYLQYLTARVFIEDSTPWTAANWTMGDRTPLMGVINSIWALSALNDDYYVFWNYQIIGIILNQFNI